MNNSFLSVKSVFENCLKSNSIAFVGAALISLALTGCGGGGGSKSAASAPLTAFTGTAAVGTAISGAPVSGLCVAGTPAPATTDPNGKYTLQLAGLTLPCILSVQVPQTISITADPVFNGTTTLYSAVYSGQAVANITPITNLIVANALGADPRGILLNGNLGTYAAKLTSANIASAYSIINTALTTAGITVPSNPLTSQFTAATTSTTGDASDKSIDLFMNAIRQTQLTNQNMTLASLTADFEIVVSSAGAQTYINNKQLTSNPNAGEMLLAASVVVDGYNMDSLPLRLGIMTAFSNSKIDYAIDSGDKMTLLGTFAMDSNSAITGTINTIIQQDVNSNFMMGITKLNINMGSLQRLLNPLDLNAPFYKVWQLITQSNGGLSVTNNGAKLICPTLPNINTANTIITTTQGVNIDQLFNQNCLPQN